MVALAIVPASSLSYGRKRMGLRYCLFDVACLIPLGWEHSSLDGQRSSVFYHSLAHESAEKSEKFVLEVSHSPACPYPQSPPLDWNSAFHG